MSDTPSILVFDPPIITPSDISSTTNQLQSLPNQSTADHDHSAASLTKRTRTEAQQLRRKSKKLRVKSLNNVVQNKGFKEDYYSICGPDCVADVELRCGDKFTARPREFQQSLLYTLNQSCEQPDWFHLKHRPLVDQVIVLVIDGLTLPLIEQYRQHLSFFYTHFCQPYVPFQCLSSPHITINGVQSILQCAVPKIAGYKPQLRVGRLLVSTLDSLFQGPNAPPAESQLIEDDFTRSLEISSSIAPPPPSAPEIDRRKYDQNFSLCQEHFLKHIRYQDLIKFSANEEDLEFSLFPVDADAENGFKHTLPVQQTNQLRKGLFDKFPHLFTRPVPTSPTFTTTVQTTESMTDDVPPSLSEEQNENSQSTPCNNPFALLAEPAPPATPQFNQGDYLFSLPLHEYPHTKYCHPMSKFHSYTLGFHACLGLDCEMVRGEDNVVMLARVSVVDIEGNPLVDTLVQPTGPVTNYLTQWSGIKPEDYLPSSGKTIILFEEARDIVLSFLSSEHILVGHGLENDLRVLKIIHHRVLDTSFLFPNCRADKRIKNSLKFLAKRFLHANIQQSTTNGHDSIEDALYAIRLAIKKIVMGPSYGINNVLSFFDVLDFFKIPTSLVSSAEICRRLSAPGTNCIAVDTDMTGPTLKWSRQHIINGQIKIDKQLMEIDNTPLLHQSHMKVDSNKDTTLPSQNSTSSTTSTPITFETMKADQEESHRRAIETANNSTLPKTCLFAHSSSLLTKCDALLEAQLHSHYCIPISEELQSIRKQHEELVQNQLKQQQLDSQVQLKSLDQSNPIQNTMSDFTVAETSPAITTERTTTTEPALDTPDESNSNTAPKNNPPYYLIPAINLPSKYRSVEFMLETQPALSINNLEVTLATLNQQLLDLWQGLPPNTMLYIVSGQAPSAFPRYLAKMAKDICDPTLVNKLIANQQTPLGIEHQAAFSSQLQTQSSTISIQSSSISPEQTILQDKFKDFANELDSLSKHIFKTNRNGLLGVHVKPTPEHILQERRQLCQNPPSRQHVTFSSTSESDSSSSSDSD